MADDVPPGGGPRPRPWHAPAGRARLAAHGAGPRIRISRSDARSRWRSAAARQASAPLWMLPK